jgi:hypothetical protein
MRRVPKGNRPSLTGMRPLRAELANAEAYEAAQKAKPKPKKAPKPDPQQHDWLWNKSLPRLRDPAPRFVPGDAVILDGPATSGWADSLPRRPWVVVECACGLCEASSHVALDVPRSPAMLEMYPDVGLWRHVSAAALRKQGEFSRERAEAWADEIAYDRVGNRLGQLAEVNDAVARLMLNELASLAFADVLGGGSLTPEQARQLEWWSEQRGGELTPEQLAHVREWQRARNTP